MHAYAGKEAGLALVPLERDPDTRIRAQFLWRLIPGSTVQKWGREGTHEGDAFKLIFKGN